MRYLQGHLSGLLSSPDIRQELSAHIPKTRYPLHLRAHHAVRWFLFHVCYLYGLWGDEEITAVLGELNDELRLPRDMNLIPPRYTLSPIPRYADAPVVCPNA